MDRIPSRYVNGGLGSLEIENPVRNFIYVNHWSAVKGFSRTQFKVTAFLKAHLIKRGFYAEEYGSSCSRPRDKKLKEEVLSQYFSPVTFLYLPYNVQS